MMVANGGQGGKGGVLSDPVLAFPSSEEEGGLACAPQPRASEYIRVVCRALALSRLEIVNTINTTYW